MIVDVWIVGFEREGRITGPYTVYETKESAQEFLSLAGPHGHALIGARMVRPEPSRPSFTSTVGLGGCSSSLVAALNQATILQQHDCRQRTIFGGLFQ